uniref:bifunctional homocysteine S-methyltransferase/methylenetetrahydrofolate reductase n=2 Tax=Alicyclobacillus acidiphilus TaxID=182455 RepID=UPI0009FA18AD|nr:bifunctional homocysteine S-methyltransferase/methylenetetrahydrofolate reductase [Alicyclobacillus acidiphilus]
MTTELRDACPTQGQQIGHRVHNHSYVVGDGAMATYLHQCGVPIRVCAEELNLSNPKLVEDVHRSYVEAGSTLIQTNTFAGNGEHLSRYGLDTKVRELNRRAVEIARAATARTDAMVYGTIGPVRGGTRYGALLTDDEKVKLGEVYAAQIAALLESNVDGLVLETFPDLEELLVALDVVRAMSFDIHVVANLSPEEVGVTRDGVRLDRAFASLRDHGANIVGLNCRLGPYGILRSYERIRLDGPGYAAFPNAGILHRSESEKLSYTGDVSNFASVMSELARLGVTWLGGCCGTTPEHIRAMVEQLSSVLQAPMQEMSTALREPSPDAPNIIVEEQTSPSRTAASPVAAARGFDVEASPSIVDLLNTRTTVIVELDPPKHLQSDKFIQGAIALQRAGVDMITMADNSLGTVRMSNLALASVLKQYGIEPLVHVTCRDRNLIGQQSHLMGLHLLGVRNILLITGDPSKYGDLPGATSVYDVSSMDLTKMVRKLNDGVGFSGRPLQRSANFVIGTAFNPHVHNFDKAIDRLKRKVAAGADYVMTQPVYEEALMERIAEATRDLGVPVCIGIMPLTTVRNAEFLHDQVPGISIPADVLARMREAAPDRDGEVGFEIAQELTDAAAAYFRGIYLITPFMRYDITVRLTQFIRARVANESLA